MKRSVSFDFAGKSAVVTGGSRGIGAAVAAAFRESGAQVTVLSRTTGLDLRDRMARARAFDEIDILVNCAGAQSHSSALELPIESWDEELELHLTAAFDLSRQAALRMIERGGGRIVNFSSIAGIQGTRGIVAYSVAKAGVIELTKCLSNEWSPRGVTVNCVAPGYIETEMLESLLADPAHAEAIRGRIPVGRFGTPDEAATLVLFLCSEEARYITGVTVPVDGGWLAR